MTGKRTLMRIFKSRKLEVLENIEIKLAELITLEKSKAREERILSAAITGSISNLASRVVELAESIEAQAVGVLFEQQGERDIETKRLLTGFINLNGELIKQMARYFQYEIEAIETTKGERTDLMPTEHDKNF